MNTRDETLSPNGDSGEREGGVTHTLLIADDDSTNREVIARMLRGEGYRLLHAANGREVIEMALGERPSLILLDVMMPVLDGYEACVRLKSNPATAGIPVIFVTARDNMDDLEHAFSLGCADYIRKPVQVSELKARVRAQLRAFDFDMAHSRSQRLEFLMRDVGRYISPKLLEAIVMGGVHAERPPQRKQLTIFFSDIIGFTQITEIAEPELLTAMLNTYFDDISRIAYRHGGTVNKFMGDAVLIFFGDPESRGLKEDALACLEMAMEMREYMNHFKERMAELNIATTFCIRMGINTGYCTVGNFGSESHMDYTIIGGPVNASARLQSRANPNQILIAEQTYELVKERIRCRKGEMLSVKGMAYPMQTYEVISYRDSIPQTMYSHESDGFQLSYDLQHLPRIEVMKLLQAELRKLLHAEDVAEVGPR